MALTFDFFRKYQKPILYTAGIFALVTFSITGAFVQFFAPGPTWQGGKLELDGREVEIAVEDWNVAAGLIRAQYDPAVVLPRITTDDEASREESLRERFAVIRRLAVESGFDASEVEVDRAIEQALKVLKELKSPTELALAQGYGSLSEYRQGLREALRVGTFLRVQALSADTMDAALAKHVLKDDEKTTLRVAVLDKKARAEELKQTGVTDEELNKWLLELPDDQKGAYTDRNQVALAAIGVVYEQFDPAEWASELQGKEAEWAEDKLKQEYEARKQQLFLKPKPEGQGGGAGEAGNKPGGAPGTGDKPGENQDGEKKAEPGKDEAANKDGESPAPLTETVAMQDPPPSSEQVTPTTAEPSDPQAPGATDAVTPPPAAVQDSPYFPFDEVKDRLQRMLQAEVAFDAVRSGRLQELQAEHMRAVVAARNEAAKATAQARIAHDKAKKSADENASSTELAAAAAAAKAELEAKEAAEKAAEDAVNAQRVAFGFVARMQELLGPRKGIETKTVDAPTNGDGLKDMGSLGTWETAWQAESMDADGDISTNLQKTTKSCFHFQTPKVVKRPLKSFELIKEAARADWFAKQADKHGKEMQEKLEKALLDLAKAKLVDKVAELEKQRDTDAAKEFSDWETEKTTKRDEAIAMRAKYENRRQSRDYQSWDAVVQSLEKDLAQREDKKKAIDKQKQEQTDKDIKTEARKVYKDVLAQAVEGTSFVIKTLPPYSTKLSSRPKFQDRYPADVKFLLANETVKGLKAGEATDVLDDATGRALYVAVCEAREPATLADVTRRELQAQRQSFTSERLTACVQQSFTLDALKKRFGYQPPVSRETETAAQGGGDKPSDG